MDWLQMIRTALRWSGRALAALVALIAAYAVSGLVGGALPANRDWRPPSDGVRIYVEDNGIHTGLVLPVAAAGVDFRDLLRPEALADPRYASLDHVVFGWGDRGFYVLTPRWSDVRPGTVLRAAIGSRDTVVHVEHVREPGVDVHRRALLLRPEEYRRLAAYVRATFAVEPGAPPPIHGYGSNDAFYAGRGTYSALNTCNAWTGAALRRAGVKMGRWTPFPNTVMQWL
jgi:uncharacterized protein (TIGR02117 family)